MNIVWIIVGGILILSIIGNLLVAIFGDAGEAGAGILYIIFGGFLGKLILTSLVVSGGCFVWNKITPYDILPLVSRWCLVAAVIILVAKIIIAIFSFGRK